MTVSVLPGMQTWKELVCTHLVLDQKFSKKPCGEKCLYPVARLPAWSLSRYGCWAAAPPLCERGALGARPGLEPHAAVAPPS